MDIAQVKLALARRRKAIKYAYRGLVPGFLVLVARGVFRDDFPEWAFWTLLVACVAPHFYLEFARCPRCNHFFTRKQTKEKNKGVGAITEGGWRRNFVEVCVNCGLRLDGTNIDLPYTIGEQVEAQKLAPLEINARIISEFLGSTLYFGIFAGLAYAFHFHGDEDINMQTFPELGYGITGLALIAAFFWLPRFLRVLGVLFSR